MHNSCNLSSSRLFRSVLFSFGFPRSRFPTVVPNFQRSGALSIPDVPNPDLSLSYRKALDPLRPFYLIFFPLRFSLYPTFRELVISSEKRVVSSPPYDGVVSLFSSSILTCFSHRFLHSLGSLLINFDSLTVQETGSVL